MPELWLPPPEVERQQRLAEQAERQRLRAPEPGPDDLPELRVLRRRYRRRWAQMLPPAGPGVVAFSIALALTAVLISPYVFWIGLALAVVVVSFATAFA